MNLECEEWIPIGTKLALITKKYFGVLTQSFKHLEIERNYSVLLFLDHEKIPVSQQCIADYFKVDKTQMVRIVDNLTGLGLITKTQNTKNRREYLVSLTEKATSIIPEMKSTIQSLNQKIFSGFSEQNKNEFCQMLIKLSMNLDLEPAVSMNMELNPFKQ